MTASPYKTGFVFVVGIVLSAVCAPARAQLVESNVLLLWNSGDEESRLIRDAYLHAHPDVIEFDLEIDYSAWPPNSIINQNNNCTGDCEADCGDDPDPHECICCSCPTWAIGSPPQYPNMAVNKYYITPEMFEVVRQRIVAFLQDYAVLRPAPENEPILAIATTRGLPAAISKSFDSIANHSAHCISSSFEGQLAQLGFPMSVQFVNPYKNRIGRSFKWLFTPCGGQEYLRGKIFLVSRIDSDDANGDGDYVDDVIALIDRSKNLTVNKFGVTIVYDCNQGNFETAVFDAPTAQYMRRYRWCVYYDNGPAFLHGPNNPANSGCGEIDPEIEGQYNAWPELAHITLGRNPSPWVA